MAKHDVLNQRKRLRLKWATRGKHMKGKHKERPKKGLYLGALIILMHEFINVVSKCIIEQVLE